jgi:cathepsin F
VCAALAVFSEEEARSQFAAFKEQYGRSYGSQEEAVFKVFQRNLEIAAQYQAKETGTAKYGVTKFMDLSPEQFRSQYLMPKNSSFFLPPAMVAPPAPQTPLASFDWRDKGVVTPVYDQAQCGSCWAFSATETMESYWALAGHGLAGLSMQQVVDCDPASYGCNGGWTYNAFKYVISAGGIDSYSSYPYTARTGSCHYNPGSVAARFSSWGYVTQNRDENQMQNFLASRGPLSVCVDASQWQYYRGGVLSSCSQSIDHCVQVTGFSDKDGQPVWNTRNSWGTGWGEAGYIYLLRGRDTCAVAQVVTYITA